MSAMNTTTTYRVTETPHLGDQRTRIRYAEGEAINRQIRAKANAAERLRTQLEQRDNATKRQRAVCLERQAASLQKKFTKLVPDFSALHEAFCGELEHAHVEYRRQERDLERRMDAYREQSERRILALRKQVSTSLVALGFELERQKGGSTYWWMLTPSGERAQVRVSDHSVPLTPEREHNLAGGGFSWARQGLELLITHTTTATDVAEFLADAEEAAR